MSAGRAQEPIVDEVAEAALVSRLRAAGCVFAEDEARLLIGEAVDSSQLDAMTSRREAGEPLEQVVGWAEFCGLRLVVEPGVFVPRRRTALMVRAALELLECEPHGDGPARGAAPIVVDLCCGVGAVAAALSAVRGDTELYAVDIDPVAVHCAEANLGGVRVFTGDLYDVLPTGIRGRVRLITANAPYVPTAEVAMMPSEARDHEARAALDGGGDGLEVQRRVIEQAPRWLSSGGSLIVESSRAQAPTSAAIMRDHGLSARIVEDDELEATVIIGTLSQSAARVGQR
ncbi:MAG TPA: putative protein N(5)-glutamine methyltransferase [Humibacter sp.]|nr:putative protein N(5)-glutamine methyltransferase [Humibacter sp.]